MDCNFTLGNTNFTNPNTLLPFVVQKRPDHKKMMDALQNPKLHRLSVNLYQLHGPIFSF